MSLTSFNPKRPRLFDQLNTLKRKMRTIVFQNWSQIFDILLENEKKNIFLIFDDKNLKKNWIASFYHFFSTFAKKYLYRPKEALDKKFMKFYVKNLPQKWQAISWLMSGFQPPLPGFLGLNLLRSHDSSKKQYGASWMDPIQTFWLSKIFVVL